MIQVQLKLRPTPCQERELRRWLWHLTAVYNWTLRQIEVGKGYGFRHSYWDLRNKLVGHSRRLDIQSQAIHGAVRTAHNAWDRCFRRLGRRPKFKGRRRPLSSISSDQVIATPIGRHVRFCGFRLKFHGQDIPPGKIKCGRIVRRSSGWYLCLFIDAEPRAIPRVADGEVGIDPGFSSLLTLSTGEKVEHPRELQQSADRLACAQRGLNRRLVARLQERQVNQRKDRNHKLSRRLVSENALIAWSADRPRAIARTFGKSVASAGHGQLRQHLVYKSLTGGSRFVEVPSRNSTRTCSACMSLTGPTGWAGLKVRSWSCSVCGTQHDRDCNAAVNTLRVGRGMRHESVREGVSEIANQVTRRSPKSPDSGGAPTP